MTDFTSSLYLGMKHSSAELPGWQQLTTGVPAALSESLQSKYAGKYIAGMQGLETGITAPSTLHLYWDLFGLLSKQKITVFIDEKIYPVSKYGIERLIIKNIRVCPFKHLDAGDLYQQVSEKLQRCTTPVILTDGLCPQCGKMAAIKAYSAIIKPFNGKIIIDDTQAFGILGKRKDAFLYGYGGGGILQWLNSSNDNIITITSLAKAFGVPLAVISGSKGFISAFEKNSVTRESSGPVSVAHLNAACNAIIINNNEGDRRRKILLNNILLTRKQLEYAGIKLNKGLFPVLSIIGMDAGETTALFKKLNDRQVRTVLTHSHDEKRSQITFIINYEHSPAQLRVLADTIKQFHQTKRKQEFIYRPVALSQN